MFDRLKQLRELKAIRDSLSRERVRVEEKGIKVVVNGKMEIEEISLNPDLPKEEQEKIIKKCVNEAMKKLQITLAQKMSKISGLGF